MMKLCNIIYFFIITHFSGLKLNSNDILKTLLDAKADPNVADGAKNTPFLSVVTHDKFFFVDTFLSKGVNINWINSKGESPLIQCIKKRSVKVTFLAFSLKININSKLESFLKPVLILT